MNTQWHYLGRQLLSGCQLIGADVNDDGVVNTSDVIAIQRFYMGRTSGIAKVGKYKFIPDSRSYPGIPTNQPDQNYTWILRGHTLL